MWQLSECIDGMAEACRPSALPVIGGNVSLYNESGGADIDPTPVLGVLGLVDRLSRAAPGLAWPTATPLVLLGAASGRRRHWVVPAGRDALGHRAPGPPHRARCPPSTSPRHAAAGAASWPRLVGRRRGRRRRPLLVRAVHDVSGGGLAVALAEMAVRRGVGCAVAGWPTARALHRAAVALRGGHDRAATSCVPGRPRPGSRRVLGRAGGDRIVVEGLVDLALAEAVAGERPRGEPGASTAWAEPVMAVRGLCENGCAP